MQLITGKKILLLYPGNFNTRWGRSMKIKPHMVYVHYFLKKYFETTVIDLDNEFFKIFEKDLITFKKKSIEKILSYEFDYLAISCLTSMNYIPSKYFAEEIKKYRPDIKIIVGGYHTSSIPEDFTYENSPFDVIVQGDINNILKFIDTDGKNVPALDKPDFLSYPYYNKNDHLGIFLSSGCPHNCTFCMEYNHKRKCLNVNEAIEYVYWIENNLCPKLLAIFDPLFGLNNKWRKKFLHGLIDNQIKSHIWIFTRIDLLDEEDIKLLSKLNVILKIGVDSFSKEMLLIMNKTKNPDKYLNHFIKISKLCNEYKILHDISLIFNHPGESPKTYYEYDKFFNEKVKKELMGKYLRFGFQKFSLFPGCFVYNNMNFYKNKYGSIFSEPEWWKSDNINEPLNQSCLSKKIIPSIKQENPFILPYNKIKKELDIFNSLSKEEFLWKKYTLFDFSSQVNATSPSKLI